MGQAELKVRVPTSVKAWLNYRAEYRGTSMNAEIIDVLKTVMKVEPAYVVLRTYMTPEGTLYTAAVNESSDDFYSGDTFDDAWEATQAKIKKLGFNLRDVRIERRVERLDAPAETDVNAEDGA